LCRAPRYWAGDEEAATVGEMMITAGKGSNFFLFVDQARLAVSDPLNVEWISGKGSLTRLTD
jgi:hypothetical protein